MKTKALIAVRSGSERVINKNLRPFADSNLLELKIKQLKNIKEFDVIIVNSNDETMLRVAENLGVETVLRDAMYATSSVSMSDVYKNMAENFNGDIVVYCNVTNPVVENDTYSNAINTYKRLSHQYDSLNSANLVKEFMFLDNKPINYDLEHQPRSQDLPDIYALNFAISIISRDDMIKYKNVIGKKPYMFGMSETESIDIDTEFDFQIAEFFYRKRYNLSI